MKENTYAVIYARYREWNNSREKIETPLYAFYRNYFVIIVPKPYRLALEEV